MNIDPRLHRIVAAQRYPLLFATISGAHLYGFPSPDSDFDLRGAHVLPLEKVVGLDVHDETVQDSRIIEGLEMDIVSHDIRKFFGLLLKKNGYVLEQLFSPLIVQTTPEHAELKALAGGHNGRPGVITKHHSHHYFGFAETQWKLFLKESPRRVKPLLYVYRVLLTGIHLMRTGKIEASLVMLNEDFRLPYIADLVARKLAGPEKSTLDEADVAFHESEYQRLRGELQAAHNASSLPEAPSDETRAALNDLLIRIRRSRPQQPVMAAPKIVQEMAYSDYHEIIDRALRNAIDEYFEVWTDILWKEKTADEMYLKHIEQYRLPIIVLSCTLLECAISFYLCTKSYEPLFKKLDRMSLLERWVESPAKFVTSYKLPTSLEKELEVLIERRKAIIHHKPYISVDGDNRHKGNEPTIKVDEHQSMRSFTSLPVRLVENLMQADEDARTPLWTVRNACASAGGQFQRGENRLGVLFSFPRELIQEIMAQGYSRDIAVDCAIRMGENPAIGEDGFIVMRSWSQRNKHIKIRPLKFFQQKQGSC